MADFEYSLDALNVKSAFYRATAIVYVEGDDDILFWEEIFSKEIDISFEIEAVGGSPELDKHITQIEAGQLNAIAARDADFLRFTGDIIDSPRIIYTHGYSMENTVYTADLVHHLARSWCKSRSVTELECEQWLNQLGSAFETLVALDIANATSDDGVSVLSDNCTRFMTNQTSATPCHKKIDAHAKQVAPKLPKDAIDLGNEAVQSCFPTKLEYLRGHLLATAVSKYILQVAKSIDKKVNISMDSLYAAAIASFRSCYTPRHPHYNYYKTATANASATFR